MDFMYDYRHPNGCVAMDNVIWYSIMKYVAGDILTDQQQRQKS